MINHFLIPQDIVIIEDMKFIGIKYFAWRMNPVGIAWPQRWPIDYGFLPYMFVTTLDLPVSDYDFLTVQPDVFTFPNNIDSPVDQGIQTFFENINLPTDWMTPSTTYRELIRNTLGIFQFNQRYGGISGVNASLFDNATLDTRLRQLTAQEQTWFYAAVESYGFDPALISDNSQLRLLVRQAASYWQSQTFDVGGGITL